VHGPVCLTRKTLVNYNGLSSPLRLLLPVKPLASQRSISGWQTISASILQRVGMIMDLLGCWAWYIRGRNIEADRTWYRGAAPRLDQECMLGRCPPVVPNQQKTPRYRIAQSYTVACASHIPHDNLEYAKPGLKPQGRLQSI